MRHRKTIVGMAALCVGLTACTAADEAVTTTTTTTAMDMGTAATAVTPSLAGSDASSGVATDEEDSSAIVTYPIADTGQRACYADSGESAPCPAPGEDLFGQDGNYVGLGLSYIDNGNGTVTDVVTGLTWQQDPGSKMTYDEAVVAVDALVLAGYDDWRLPTIKELYSLIDFNGTDPSSCDTIENCAATPFIDVEFFDFSYGDTSSGERVIDAQYLSSTLYVDTTMFGDATAFGVNFADGRIKGYGLTDPRGGEKAFFVMAVRGQDRYGENVFVDNGDGTVSDVASGLVWQQSDDGVGRDWSEAIDYCETLVLGGKQDWRLGDIKELQSLVDYSRSPDISQDYSRSPDISQSAAIDPVFSTSVITDEGGEDNFGFYWSSTTHVSLMGGMSAAYMAFGDALGWMQDFGGNYVLLDVHGAGSQRSDPKLGDSADYPFGRGPQGDVIRVDNLVRCVRSGGQTVTSGTTAAASPDAGGATDQGTVAGGPLADAAAMLGVTEQALVDALGPPGDGEPDLAAAAVILGITESELREALPPPPVP